jgi:hypothetical protein
MPLGPSEIERRVAGRERAVVARRERTIAADQPEVAERDVVEANEPSAAITQMVRGRSAVPNATSTEHRDRRRRPLANKCPHAPDPPSTSVEGCTGRVDHQRLLGRAARRAGDARAPCPSSCRADRLEGARPAASCRRPTKSKGPGA